MIVEIGSNPNCSEATIRIDLTGQNEKDIKALVKKLNIEFDTSDWNKPKTHDWDDEKVKSEKEFDLSEAYVSYENIFGKETLRIHGDAPFNFADDVEEIINRYLPKAERQWSEP